MTHPTGERDVRRLGLVATSVALLSIALGILVVTGIARNMAAIRRTWREAR